MAIALMPCRTSRKIAKTIEAPRQVRFRASRTNEYIFQYEEADGGYPQTGTRNRARSSYARFKQQFHNQSQVVYFDPFPEKIAELCLSPPSSDL